MRAQAVTLPTVLPADLLGRRPDLVAQRWRIEAARRDIDAAKAQFYPNLNLNALVGLESINFGKLLDVDSANPAYGPALRLPLFDGGRLRGNLAARDADYDLAVSEYNRTLIDAMREVVDQLAAFKSLQAQQAELERGLAAAREAHDLAMTRYRAGLASYLQVLATETPLLEQESLRANLHARALDTSINLMRALGGGFDATRDSGAS
jgi:NodT family efflux transporter outer membrane factor (OMF) lipoprotein